MCVCVCVCVCTVMSSSATQWTVAHQALLSMGFSRQEYWSGFPCPPPGDLPNPVIEPLSLMLPALADRFFTTASPGKYHITYTINSRPFNLIFMNLWYCCHLYLWFSVPPIIFLSLVSFIFVSLVLVHYLTHSKHPTNICYTKSAIICTLKMNYSLFPGHTTNFPLHCFLFMSSYSSWNSPNLYQILTEPSEHNLRTILVIFFWSSQPEVISFYLTLTTIIIYSVPSSYIPHAHLYNTFMNISLNFPSKACIFYILQAFSKYLPSKWIDSQI